MIKNADNLEKLLKEMQPFIEIVAWETSNNTAINDDLQQEARIAVMKAFRKGEAKHGGYYIPTVVHAIKNAAERRSWTGSERPTGTPIDPLRLRSTTYLPEYDTIDQSLEDPGFDAVDNQGQYFDLHQALSRLSDSSRRIIHLMYWRSYSYDELAKAVGQSKATVARHLTDARTALREELESVA